MPLWLVTMPHKLTKRVRDNGKEQTGEESERERESEQQKEIGIEKGQWSG